MITSMQKLFDSTLTSGFYQRHTFIVHTFALGLFHAQNRFADECYFTGRTRSIRFSIR